MSPSLTSGLRKKQIDLDQKKAPGKREDPVKDDENYCTAFPVTTTKFHWGAGRGGGSQMEAKAADAQL